jgi:hypothetical protein
VLNETFGEDGAIVFRDACRLGCECRSGLGRAQSLGANRRWVKVKNPKSPAGLTRGRGRLGALMGLSAIALDKKDDPKYWRDRAKEARAIAVQMKSAHTKAVMLGIAQDYEKLAQRAEQRAGKPL